MRTPEPTPRVEFLRSGLRAQPALHRPVADQAEAFMARGRSAVLTVPRLPLPLERGRHGNA